MHPISSRWPASTILGPPAKPPHVPAHDPPGRLLKTGDARRIGELFQHFECFIHSVSPLYATAHVAASPYTPPKSLACHKQDCTRQSKVSRAYWLIQTMLHNVFYHRIWCQVANRLASRQT